MNPYESNQYSKFQLDMRRKAEILKYSANRSSTQTNNPTKKQNFSSMVKGSTPSPSQGVLNKMTSISCPADNLIPTPTSSCDVPGPVTYLYNDETIPLYNYSDFNTRSYSDQVPSNYDPWNLVRFPDVVVPSTVYYLIMQNTINTSQYNYTLTVPVGISVYGKMPSGFAGGNITIMLKSATLAVYYGSNLVNTFSTNVSDIQLKLNLHANATEFSANQFVGNLIFSNIMLYTAPTYVYTFNLGSTFQNLPTNVQSAKLIANISPANYSLNGCNLIGTNAAINAGSSIQ
jgi:hypothetical protein